MAARILLVRKLPGESRARSAVVGETGFYWRDLATEDEIAAALRGESFSLIIVDHRGVPGDPLPFVESLRKWKREVPIFLFGEELEFEGVVRAMRAGVKDLFHPPLNLLAIVERIHSELKAELGTSRSSRPEDWTELTLNFVEDWCASPGGHAASARNGDARVHTLPLVVEERDRLAADLKAMRDAVGASRAKLAECEEEIHRLRATPSGAGQPGAIAGAGEGEIALALEKLEAEQSLLDQRQKEHAATQARHKQAAADLTRREQALVAQERELAAVAEKLDAEALLVTQSKARVEKERGAAGEAQAAEQKLAAQDAALAQARAEHEHAMKTWQEARVKAEKELAEREQAIANVQPEAKRLIEERENFEAEQSMFVQGKKKFEAESAAARAMLEGKQLEVAAAREKLEGEMRLLDQARARMEKERGATGETTKSAEAMGRQIAAEQA
ncbi:MAG: hypothetical protein ABIZ49_10595, partial [Opitutaceae bacterium]